jgi:hypothetical protein
MHPFQVALEGTVFRPDEVATVPLHVATLWTQNGWVEGVTADDSATANEAGDSAGKPSK